MLIFYADVYEALIMGDGFLVYSCIQFHRVGVRVIQLIFLSEENNQKVEVFPQVLLALMWQI